MPPWTEPPLREQIAGLRRDLEAVDGVLAVLPLLSRDRRLLLETRVRLMRQIVIARNEEVTRLVEASERRVHRSRARTGVRQSPAT